MFVFRRLRRWSLARLVLVCIGWMVVSTVALVAYTMVFLFESGAGAGAGVGAVSFGIDLFKVFLFAAAPAALLAVLWLIARRV